MGRKRKYDSEDSKKRHREAQRMYRERQKAQRKAEKEAQLKVFINETSEKTLKSVKKIPIVISKGTAKERITACMHAAMSETEVLRFKGATLHLSSKLITKLPRTCSYVFSS